MSGSWDDAMDAFATRLVAQRVALQQGVPDSVPPFAPPPSLGPLPWRLRDRAESLLQEAAELQAEMTARLASTTREVQAVRRFVSATATPVGASYIDGSL
jgi:hypothetical protein